ncbi:MAG: protein kinase [Actinomycetota bacterium]|nr:protein kinase [Actinomycetota bacterium]
MAERTFSGRYRVVRHLARGGMAEVYLGHDELLDRPVAIKVLFPELAGDESFVERFRREARAAAGLNHHNIVSIYDFGDDDGVWFIVMEYVDGPTLRDVIRADGPMEPAEAVQIGAEIAAALGASHAQGIIHRDVKPANVLIAGQTVKVTDFGIARAANAIQGLTMPGTVVGTATYLSPEQAQGKAVDFRSDLYSLGMVIYEMLAGKAPYAGETPIAIARKQLTETPPAPSTVNPRVPPALDTVVLRAMAVNPADRQPTAEDLRAELLAAAPATGDPNATLAIAAPLTELDATSVVRGGPSTTMLPPVTARPAPRRADPEMYRRRRAAVIAGLALVAIAIIVVLALLNNNSKAGTATVPPLVGQAVTDATAALDRVGLHAKLVDQDLPGAVADRVADQTPKAGAIVKKGSDVTLVVPRVTSTTSSTRPVATTQTSVATTTTAAPATTQAPVTTVTTVRPTTTVVSTTIARTTTTF